MTILSWLRRKKQHDQYTGKLRSYVTDHDTWIIRGFLTAKEKRALIELYRADMGCLLSKKSGELTKEEEHVYSVAATRIKFIMDHF